MALRRRFLQDIAELQGKPYPNIKLVPYENEITTHCLILTPNGGAPLHLTINFPKRYPLKPPIITIQTSIEHPNVFGSYICASILNTTEGYTPAYTLKGIAIQILSFFSSDKLEQDHGAVYDLGRHRDEKGNLKSSAFEWSADFTCERCGHGRSTSASSNTVADAQPSLMPSSHQEDTAMTLSNETDEETTNIASLADELLVLICSKLETEELALFARSWNRIGGEHGVVSQFNVIRNRELVCFCLKMSFEEAKLGIGVQITFRGRRGTYESEFDLLGLQAFEVFQIRRSVQNLPFQEWLPLPISRRHYNSVKDLVEEKLLRLGNAALFTSTSPVDVLYGFMNDIVIRLSDQVGASTARSSLVHASEKAIESYYHLYHLLICLAAENTTRVGLVNQTIKGFLEGKTTKNDIPNLGYLLIAILISDADMTIDLLMAIIKETVTRNVVWVLDRKGANMPELAYMEADNVSLYRLQKTFDASKTSYRLLMFLNTFRRTINRGSGRDKKTIVQLRDELFDAHGAPLRGMAAQLANDIKAIQQVDSFPQFLKNMGLSPPHASQFTGFLRECVEDSVRKGYSVWGISQERALTLRRQVDADVKVRGIPKPEWAGGGTFELSFFPNNNKTSSRGRGGGQRRGRGGRRGR